METPAAAVVSWLSIPWLKYGIPEQGWPHFVETHLQREMNWFAEGGISKARFVLHNPGFTPVGGMMQFDQWLQNDRQLLRLRDQFADAWRPVVESGHEVICYLGALRWINPELDSHNPSKLHDADFAELAKPFRWNEWLDRVVHSLAPALAAGCNLAFDTFGQITPRHPGYHLVQLLQTTGARCYIEPPPPIWANREFAHWYGSPKIMVNETLNRDNLPAFSKHFTGELMRVCNAYATVHEEEVTRITQILADGHTAAFRVFGSGKIKGAADLNVRCQQLLAAVPRL